MAETEELIVDIPVEVPKKVGITETEEPKGAEKKPRKPRGPNKKKAKPKVKPTVPLSAEKLGKQFQGLHAIAHAFKPAVVVPDDEASQAVGESLYEIIEIYGLEWLGKYGPFINLGAALLAAEAPTLVTLVANRGEKKEKLKGEPPPQPKNDVTFPLLTQDTKLEELELSL